MKINELNELTTAEMLEKEKQFKEELFNLRFQLATGQLENTARLKEVRKSIAQDSVASKRIKQVRIRRRRLIAHE